MAKIESFYHIRVIAECTFEYGMWADSEKGAQEKAEKRIWWALRAVPREALAIKQVNVAEVKESPPP